MVDGLSSEGVVHLRREGGPGALLHIPLRLVLSKDFPLRVIRDDFGIDVTPVGWTVQLVDVPDVLRRPKVVPGPHITPVERKLWETEQARPCETTRQRLKAS